VYIYIYIYISFYSRQNEISTAYPRFSGKQIGLMNDELFDVRANGKPDMTNVNWPY